MQSPLGKAIEILVVFVLVFAIASFAPNPDFVMNGVELAAITAFIFGYSIYSTRGVRRPARFWWTWSVFLLLHLALCIQLLLSTGRWHRGQFLYLYLAEFAFILTVLTSVLPARDTSKRPD
jgi:hypothetical protein